MVFCRAFQSLPSRVLETFFGLLAIGSYANIGLNVIPPLFQSVGVDNFKKLQYTINISQSQDPEVRRWISARQAQKPQWKNTLRHAYQSVTVLNYIGAL